MAEKKKILWLSDSPTAITGFSQVARNLLKEMIPPNTYDLTILGINYFAEAYMFEDYPYIQPSRTNYLAGLWPAKDDQSVYGFNKTLQFLQAGKFDIFFCIQDPMVLGVILPHILKIREGLEKKFAIIFYYPIDGVPRKPWITDTIAKVDYSVVYTEFGRREILAVDPTLEDHIRVIGHGTEPKTFYPIPGPARQLLRTTLFRGIPSDYFIVLNVNRNQPRKDPLSTFEIFAKFHKKWPKSFLFFHAAPVDKGGNLVDMAESFGLVQGKDWSCPDPKVFNTVKGIPIEVLNQLYSCADLLISTTYGEGWGLSVTEAMACKVPVLVPRHTSLIEIVGDNEERGTFIKSGGPGHWVSLGQEDPIPRRPKVDIDDAVDKMLNIARYPKKYAQRADRAFQWAQENTWEAKGAEWRAILAEALAKQEEENAAKRADPGEQEAVGTGEQQSAPVEPGNPPAES